MSTTIQSLNTKMANPPHPGRIVKSALEAMKLSAETFAQQIDVPISTMTQLLQGETAITPALAEKLSQHISGPETDTWLRMQAAYNDSQPSSHRKSKKDDL